MDNTMITPSPPPSPRHPPNRHTTNSPRPRGIMSPLACHKEACPSHHLREIGPMTRPNHDILSGRDKQGGASDLPRPGDGGDGLKVAPRLLLHAVSEHF